MTRIAITTGDPAGIGHEITSKALRFIELKKNIIYVVYGKMQIYNNGNQICMIDNIDLAVSSDKIYWIKINEDNIKPGKPTKKSGEIAYDILERCTADLNSKKLDAVVTCPISKEAIHHSHPEFIGHTEFFAERSKTKEVIMSFWGPHFNLALLTTHMAVSDVPLTLSKDVLRTKFELIFKEISVIINSPRIAMLAINPHAGEGGAFGKEDILVKSVLDELSKKKIIIDGPFPADTFFSRKASQYDLIISAFHDQGLIPFKLLSADEGVNVTLGLPFIRTSVDHGTAFDIAGKGIASEKSLMHAIKFSEKLLFPSQKTRKENYSVFAEYYDDYMSHVRYERWVKFILDQYNKSHKGNPSKILELACGTANVSSLLVKKGLNVDASDNSEEMLKVASEKPFCPNLSRKEMTAELPVDSYDLVLLLFDSINYLQKKTEIDFLLSNVYDSLKKGGVFIFDVTTPKNCEQNFDGFLNIEDNPGSYFIHQSEFGSTSNIQTTSLTFFIKKGFLFSRFDEVHIQKIYKAEELIGFIERTKFLLKGIYSIDYDDNLLNKDIKTLDKNFTRLFFILEK